MNREEKQRKAQKYAAFLAAYDREGAKYPRLYPSPRKIRLLRKRLARLEAELEGDKK